MAECVGAGQCGKVGVGVDVLFTSHPGTCTSACDIVIPTHWNDGTGPLCASGIGRISVLAA